ncbi:unnamed protein product [Trifolium pratense]|uniref:Uncharacterized protein n=1 Tax=Trifolium pratense TaxID=57577 RepID=A0ACB0LPE8_TRIPR|nr:unnamed protein product [Trifolium pratense]
MREVWNIGRCNQQISIVEEGEGESTKSSNTNTIMSRFESPASAFYATENCMGFAEFDNQVDNSNNNPCLSSQLYKLNDLEFPLYQSLRENNHFLESSNQLDPNLEFSNTLQALVKSQLNGNQCLRSPENSNKFLCEDFPGIKSFPIEQQKLFFDGLASASNSSSFCNKGNHDYMVAQGPYHLSVEQLNFASHHDQKLCPTISAGSSSTSLGNTTSNGNVVSSKTRIRWTKDLHEKFVECVNRLGGAEKATPKAILKMMDSDVLTIFHVKSHLQKYRTAKFMPESVQGKSDKRIHTEDLHHVGVKTGFQIKEALQLQLDAQRRLHEQLEIQRMLQLRLEEQGRQLKEMFDKQQKTSNNLFNTPNTVNDDSTKISHKDAEVSISEGAENSLIPCKISLDT